MRKFVLILGSLVGLLLLAAIIVPLVVDVDKYRPMIVSKANERINGKLELGKLGLSLWGRVKIDVDGLKLVDSKGRMVVDVKDAAFNLPLLGLISGRPEVRIQMDSPAIDLVKQRDGKLNAMTLMKEAPADGSSASPAQGQGSGAAQPAGAKGGSTEVPALALNSRFTVLLNHAKLSYKDEQSGDSYKVNDLDFRLEDVSPSSDMPFEVAANLDLLMQQKIKVAGPVVLKGNVKAKSSSGSFEKADAKASLVLDGAEITYPGTLHKAKGVPLGADLSATVGKDNFNVPAMKFRLADVVIEGQASGSTSGNVTTIDFKAHSNRIDVSKLGDLSPMVKEYGLNGLLELGVRANGPTDKLAYGADLKFNKVTLSNESLKQPLEVNGAVTVATNQVQDMNVKLTAKDFDLSLSGNIQNLLAPRFRLSMVSNNMDLDGLLKASEKAAAARKENAGKTQSSPAGESSGGGAPAQAPVVDYNAMFKPLRENPVTAAAAGTFDFNLKRVKSTGVVISDFKGELALDKLLLALKGFSMRIFDGAISGGMTFNARLPKPEVATNIAVTGLQTQKMVESQMPIARNTVKGVISANLNIGGPGLNQSDIISAWKGSGGMTIKDAVFSTLDVGKQVKEGVVNKLPEALRSKVNIPESVLSQKGEYQTVSAKFNLANGVMNIGDFEGKAYPNKGLDLKGLGNVKLANYGLEFAFDVIDTYNLTRGNEFAVDKRYGKFAVSGKLGCTLFSPCYDFGATVTKLAQSVLEKRGKEALQKAIGGNLPGGLGKIFGGGDSGQGGDQPKQEAPKPQEAVKALKGLFGR